MLFKDRIDAGERLGELLGKNLSKDRKQTVIISLLRGGIIVGDVVAKKLSLPHLPLVVVKISAPHQPELAIGALCFDQTYWERLIINSLRLSPLEITKQRLVTKNKFNDYCFRFNIQKNNFKTIKNKNIILIDDGVATGSTVRAAGLFLINQGVKKITLASPVAPIGFKNGDFDKIIIIHKDPYLLAISQFYESFPQVEDQEVKKILNSKL